MTVKTSSLWNFSEICLRELFSNAALEKLLGVELDDAHERAFHGGALGEHGHLMGRLGELKPLAELRDVAKLRFVHAAGSSLSRDACTVMMRFRISNIVAGITSNTLRTYASSSASTLRHAVQIVAVVLGDAQQRHLQDGLELEEETSLLLHHRRGRGELLLQVLGVLSDDPHA